MDKKIKLIVIVLFAIAAISLILAFNFLSQKQDIESKAIQEIQSLEQENESLSIARSKLESSNKSLSSDLNKAKSRLQDIDDEIKMLNERYESVSKDRDSLVNKVQTLIEEKQKLKGEFEEEKKELERAIKEQEKEKGGKKIIVGAYEISPEQEAQWAEVLRKKAELEFELQSAQSQLKEMTYKVEASTRGKGILEMELKELAQFKEDLERRASYNEKLADSLAGDLVREKNDKELLVTQLDKLRQDGRQMRSRIKDLEETKTTLYKKLDNLEQQRNILQGKLRNTADMLDERVGEVVKVRKQFDSFKEKQSAQSIGSSRTVELSPIIVQGKEEPSPTSSTLTGRVLSINKDYNFVIVDLGEQVGVRVNDEFVVYRDNRYIGHLKVVQLRGEIAAADIKDLTSGEEVRVGDIAKGMQ